ncbi:hypothetical protein [Methylovirgula sp. 4M-Z18]|uniref:hypothetical protein n=1 Tax=Methylovirgula sp. 4M-Z18 TaxID=2293567 RepID=UPI0013149B96|nr:hypothetical protein [Methylovirgula sp. 4M-Z18]
MNTFKIALSSAALAAIIGFAATGGANAESKTACRDQWRAMKANGTLNPPNLKQKDYVATCSAGGAAAPAPAQAPAPAAPAPQQQAAPAPAAPAPAAPAPAKPSFWNKTKPAQAPTAAPAAPVQTGNAGFPRAVDPQFASFPPEQQRIKTCGAQWKVNKSNGQTGGLKWPQYWSQCNKVLKGEQL